MKKKLYILVLALSIQFNIGCSIKQTQFGVDNQNVKDNIVRANSLIMYYQNSDFKAIEKKLLTDLKIYENDKEAKRHLYYELADLYSYRLLDIEKAIKFDTKIAKLGKKALKKNGLYLSYSSANNLMLVDENYKKNYLNISYSDIMKDSKKRLLKNHSLLKSNILQTSKRYDFKMLNNNLKNILIDLENISKDTPEYYQIISRLLRTEYEIYKTTKNKKFISKGSEYIINNNISLNQIDLSEINFLALADYLSIAGKNKNNIKLQEYALYTVYRPYLNLKDKNDRWTYNKLINRYIDDLIKSNFHNKNYKDMLYYISLNKSRMILEDKASTGEESIALIVNYPLNKYGLPKKEYFYKKASHINNFLDFYFTGNYYTVSVKKKSISQATSLTRMRAIARRNNKVDIIEEYKADSMLVTQIIDGVIKVRSVNKNQLKKFKKSFDSCLANVSIYNSKENIRAIARKNKKLQTKILPFKMDYTNKSKDEILISPDKWLSQYPLDYILNIDNSVRTLNLFTATNDSKILKDIDIIGYFNPTLDLPAAEDEKTVIKKLFPSSKLYSKSEATIERLNNKAPHDILHLSMHGMNNDKQPDYSKLFFAGSKLDDSKNDIKALYAKKMSNYVQLKDNELVFTAACETGLTKSGKTNQSEIMGILRPLLTNNNKNIILTLWEVESNSAKDFVTFFYEELQKSNQIKLSFQKAKRRLKNKYPEPKFWAPYYLIVSN